MNPSRPVSLIIPLYNVAAYVQRCLDSLRQQDLSLLEILFIDDGSTDETVRLVEAFIRNFPQQPLNPAHPRIQLIRQANSGQGAARNRGLDLATGRYIAYLDADDFLPPATLKILYHIAEADRIELVLCRHDLAYLQPDGTIRYQPISHNIQDGAVVTGPDTFTQLIKQQQYSALITIQFVRRDVITRLGLRFPEGINHEDELYTFLLLLQCRRVRRISRLCYHRLIRPGSVMTGQSLRQSLKGYSTVLAGMVDFAKRQSWPPTLRKIVWQRLRKTLDNAIARFVQLSPTEKTQEQATYAQLCRLIRNESGFHRLKYRLFAASEPLFSQIICLYHRLKR